MKILHTSDWHLGKIIFEKSMIDDQKYFINNTFFDVLLKEKPNLIIISGDVFDRQIASLEAIRLFNDFLTRVCKDFKIPIAIITGNHDSADRISVASQILKDSGVYIVSDINDENKIVSIYDDTAKVDVVLLPFFDLQNAKIYLNENNISLNEAYCKIITNITEKLDNDNFNILVSHCFVTGSENFKSEDAISMGTLAEVSSKTFNKFDYVALGHIHSAQNVGINARYCGAPIKYSFDEPNKNKTMTLIDIKGKKFKIKEIQVNPKHNMRTIKGEFKKIIENAKLNPSKDYICIELLDKVPVYMPMEQLRVYYPNVLTMKNQWMRYINLQDDNLKEKITSFNEKNEEYVFTQFLREICNIEPEKEDYEIFNGLCEKLKREDML